MNNHLVVLSFLSVCALAGVYYVPKLPCEWTLIWNCSNPQGETWHVVQQVNGDFVRMERIGLGASFWEESVFRSDLDDEHIMQFTESNEGHFEQIPLDSTVRLYKRPIYFNNDEMTFTYDTRTNDTYFGVECIRYHNNNDNADFYVGFDGLPSGWVTERSTVNFTWQKTAPLSWFVFDRSVTFNDERIYTAPNESICPQVSSSSSSLEPQSSEPSPSPEPQSSEPSPSPEPQSSEPSAVSMSSSHVHTPSTQTPSMSSSQTVSLLTFALAALIYFIAHH